LGVQLALEKFGPSIKKLGIKVSLEIVDDEGRSDIALAKANEFLKHENILVVIGHLFSGITIPVSVVYRQGGIPLIAASSTDPLLTDRGLPNIKRVIGRYDVQGRAGAEFAAEMGAKSAFIVTDKSTYGESIARSFHVSARKKDIKVLGTQATQETFNFSRLLKRIAAEGPELIYFAGRSPGRTGRIMKQAREMGIKSYFMGPSAIGSPLLAQIAGNASVGMYYTDLVAPAAVYPAGKAFAKEYKGRFGREARLFAAQGFDAANLAFKAIEQAAQATRGRKVTRDRVLESLRKVRLKGITGTLEFNKKGDLKRSKYFVKKVVSSDPRRWGENKIVKVLELPPSAN